MSADGARAEELHFVHGDEAASVSARVNGRRKLNQGVAGGLCYILVDEVCGVVPGIPGNLDVIAGD